MLDAAQDAAARLARARAGREGTGDDGDVPGWVLITVMTAGLVLAIYTTARGRIEALVEGAFTDILGGQ